MIRLEVDDPPRYYLSKAQGDIRGWFASVDVELPEEFWFEIGNVRIAHRRVLREDVETAMPECNVVAFLIPYDLKKLLPYIDGQSLTIRLILPEYPSRIVKFTIAEGAMANCLAAASEI